MADKENHCPICRDSKEHCTCKDSCPLCGDDNDYCTCDKVKVEEFMDVLQEEHEIYDYATIFKNNNHDFEILIRYNKEDSSYDTLKNSIGEINANV